MRRRAWMEIHALRQCQKISFKITVAVPKRMTCHMDLPRGDRPFAYDARVGTDPYPIPSAPIGNVALWTRTTDDEVMGLKPIWQVPQAFAWADCRGPDSKNDRFPTREEMLNMTWQCVANGANGIVYWCYRLLYKKGKFMVDRWADICAAAATR